MPALQTASEKGVQMTLKCLVCLEGMDLRLNSKGVSFMGVGAAGDR